MQKFSQKNKLNPCQDGLGHLFREELSKYKLAFALFCPKIGAPECPFECRGGPMAIWAMPKWTAIFLCWGFPKKIYFDIESRRFLYFNFFHFETFISWIWRRQYNITSTKTWFLRVHIQGKLLSETQLQKAGIYNIF